jgi:MYXO-CTERM domain-containing protein
MWIGLAALLGVALGQDCPDVPSLALELPGDLGAEVPPEAALVASYVHTVPELMLRTASGARVPLGIAGAPPDDAWGGRGWVHLEPPEAGWPLGELSLVAGGETVSKLLVVDSADTRAPERPTLLQARSVQWQTEQGDWQALEIPLGRRPNEPVVYEVRFSSDGPSFEGDPLLAADASAIVFSDGPCGGDPAAHFEPDTFWVEVVAVDLAGNRSRPAVLEPGARRSGCQTATGPAGAFALLGLLGLRRRRPRAAAR